MIITDTERANGKLTADHAAEAETQLRDAGYTILEAVFTREYAEALRLNYLELLASLQDSGDVTRLHRSAGEQHFQIQPPLVGGFADPQVVANSLVLQCMRPILGEDLLIAFYNSNVSGPGSGHQAVHRDTWPLFGAVNEMATPAHLLVANILLSDFTVENGSTEIWPGTHLLTDRHNGVACGTSLDQRSEALCSRRLNAPAGSVVIRDMRMWHRGTPNLTDEFRAMLSLVYKRNWFKMRFDSSLQVPRETAERWDSEVAALFAR